MQTFEIIIGNIKHKLVDTPVDDPCEACSLHRVCGKITETLCIVPELTLNGFEAYWHFEDESEYHKMIEGEFLKNGNYHNWTEFEKQCLRDAQELVKEGVVVDCQRVHDVLVGMTYMFNKLTSK